MKKNYTNKEKQNDTKAQVTDNKEQISVGSKYLAKFSLRWWIWVLCAYLLGQLFSFLFGAIGWFISSIPLFIGTFIYLEYMKKRDKI